MEKKHGPWKIVSSEVKYKNPWIEVVEDKVIRPDGKPGIYGFMKLKNGVCILPLDENGFCYLVEEFGYAVGRTCLENVAGGIDGNEQPLEAAKRELREEIGIEATNWTDLGSVDALTMNLKCQVQLFVARKLKFVSASPEATEKIKMVKMPFSEAVEKAMQGEITNGPSVAVILKAKLFLEREKGKN